MRLPYTEWFPRRDKNLAMVEVKIALTLVVDFGKGRCTSENDGPKTLIQVASTKFTALIFWQGRLSNKLEVVLLAKSNQVVFSWLLLKKCSI